jgi:hypothetical protein
MRLICLLTLYLACYQLSHAEILVVDNNPGSTALYSNINDAIAAANPGDTLHIIGSATQYPAATVDKELTLIGAGFDPQKDNPVVASLNGITIRTGGDGSVVQGLHMGGIGVENVSNILIEGCYFTYYTVAGGGSGSVNISNSHNIIVRGNAILFAVMVVPIPVSTNIFIENNIIFQSGHASSWGMIVSAKDASHVIRNNVFIGDNRPAFDNCNNIQVLNNIFYDQEPINCSNCVMLNNLTYLTDNMLPEEDDNQNADPMFVNAPSPESNGYSTAFDFNLQDGSPGIDAGTDGKDLGIYGGLIPYRKGGEPPIPKISVFNILNTAVPPGGELNIEIESISVK